MTQNPAPVILHDLHLRLLGCAYYGNPFHSAGEFKTENEIGKLWIRFFELYKKYSAFLSHLTPDWRIGYEIHIESDEYTATREYCVFVGIEVGSIEDQPPELFGKVLPKSSYVMVTTAGMNHKPVEHLLNEWLPQSEYMQAYRYIIERYDSRRFRSLDDPKSEIDWMVPIRRRIAA